MQPASSGRFRAVLLLGPTGSGKTPLGDWLEQHGLWDGHCHHFDFGANLRALVASGPCADFPAPEIRFLQGVLDGGRLLEDSAFPLAARVFDAFVRRREIRPDDCLLLNGLPRHAGQAVALQTRIEVVAVIELLCDPPTVMQRLRLDVGGDRAHRHDDHLELVTRKLATYDVRTRPLTNHYRRQGARLLPVKVQVATQPADIARLVEPLRPDRDSSG